MFITVQRFQKGSFKNGKKSRDETGQRANALSTKTCSKTMLRISLGFRETYPDMHLLFQRFQNVVVVVVQKNGTQSWVFINLGFTKKVKLQVAQHFALKRGKIEDKSFARKLLITDNPNRALCTVAVSPQQSEQHSPNCMYRQGYDHMYLTILQALGRSFLRTSPKPPCELMPLLQLAVQLHSVFRICPKMSMGGQTQPDHGTASDVKEVDGLDPHCNPR